MVGVNQSSSSIAANNGAPPSTMPPAASSEAATTVAPAPPLASSPSTTPPSTSSTAATTAAPTPPPNPSPFPTPPPSGLTGEGFIFSRRKVPPAHYTFKIESFSLLLSTGLEKYETGDFEAGGYKWRLSVYPSGNKEQNGNGHISLFLAMAEPSSLPLGWELKVEFKLFVLDQIKDKYSAFQDAALKPRRFNVMKTERGFARLLSLYVFNHPSNGYLFNDSCVFGAEVFVIKSNGKGELLSMINEPENGLYRWQITSFSTKDKEFYFSEIFTIEGRKWKLKLYPGGDSRRTNTNLSFYLVLDESEMLPPKRKLYAKFILRIRDQINANHHEFTGSRWFDAPGWGWGSHAFMLRSDLNDLSKGFLVNDTLIAEAQIMVVSVVKDF